MSVINFQDLYQAYRVCRRRKRKTANTQRYEMQLLDNLFDTLAELQGRSYQPQRSLCFVAKQPKAREIHAADFSDRVIHHWLVPRLEAIYEPVFIHDVYSNRQGKGTHKAVQRLQSFMRSTHSGHYFLQLDIANFFNTIDRSVLFNLIQQRLQKAVAKAKVFREEAVVMRWLVYVILKHDVTDACFYRGRASDFALIPPHKRLSEAGDSKGLPIGNLTSQCFSGYHGQVKVIRRYYPLAHVRIQRGIDWDQFSPLLKQQECAALQIIRVVAVETNERYRGGLKKRLVSHIEFNRSLL